MSWFVVAIVLAIVLVVGIWFLHRFYAKANREIALVRTGLGGQKVVLDGGCLALPLLHKVAEVNLGGGHRARQDPFRASLRQRSPSTPSAPASSTRRACGPSRPSPKKP